MSEEGGYMPGALINPEIIEKQNKGTDIIKCW